MGLIEIPNGSRRMNFLLGGGIDGDKFRSTTMRVSSTRELIRFG
jgi:hypothetical protein